MLPSQFPAIVVPLSAYLQDVYARRFCVIVAAFLAAAMGTSSDQITVGETESALPKTSPEADSSSGRDYANETGQHQIGDLIQEEPVMHWQFLSRIRLGDDNHFKMESLSDPVVADGVVYFVEGGRPSRVFAVDADDGSLLWQYEHLVDRFSGDPSVDADHVYFGSSIGVTALRRKDGTLAWHRFIEHGSGGGVPLPIGGRVFVSGYDGHAYALDCQTGDVVWRRDLVQDAPADQPGFEGERARFGGKPARPRGAASDGDLFIQSIFDQSRVVALNCKDGSRKWAFNANGWIGPAPTIWNEFVFVCSQDKHLYCLDRETGKEHWRFEAPTWLASRVAVRDGIVFLPVHRGRMYQLDVESGKVLHYYDPSGEKPQLGAVYTFPLVSDEGLLWTTGNGHVLGMNSENKRLWRLRPSAQSELFSNPTTDGTRIYASCRQGPEDVGVSAILAFGPWGNRLGPARTQSAQGTLPSRNAEIRQLTKANQHGPTGQLLFLPHARSLAIVFPKESPDWDVFEQIREFNTSREAEQNALLKSVVEGGLLDSGQAARLKIAIGRHQQFLLRHLRDLVVELQAMSWEDFQEEDKADNLRSRVRTMQEQLITRSPAQPGMPLYQSLDSVLDDEQREALTQYYSTKLSPWTDVLGLSKDQANSFRSAVGMQTENPLDLHPINLPLFLRSTMADNPAGVEVFLDEEQRKLLQAILEN